MCEALLKEQTNYYVFLFAQQIGLIISVRFCVKERSVLINVTDTEFSLNCEFNYSKQ